MIMRAIASRTAALVVAILFVAGAAFAEDVTFQPEQHDEARAQRISELEALVDRYKGEAQTLHSELSAIESSEPAAVGLKRPRAMEDDGMTNEQLGALSRKNRTLQDEMGAVQTQLALREKELEVRKSVGRERVS